MALSFIFQSADSTIFDWQESSIIDSSLSILVPDLELFIFELKTHWRHCSILQSKRDVNRFDTQSIWT